MRRAQREGIELGDNFLEIRYESLKKNPIATYRKLYDFCGFPYDDQLLDQIFEKTDFQRNYDGKETEFRRGGRVGDWRRRFSLLDSYRFHRQAGKLLAELGYAKPFWWLPRPIDKIFAASA